MAKAIGAPQGAFLLDKFLPETPHLMRVVLVLQYGNNFLPEFRQRPS